MQRPSASPDGGGAPGPSVATQLLAPQLPINCLNAGPVGAQPSSQPPATSQQQQQSAAAVNGSRVKGSATAAGKLPGPHTTARGASSAMRGNSKATKEKAAAAGSTSTRETLLAAVALQDHIARTMRIPGGPKAQPSMQPGASMTLAQHLGLVARPPPLLTKEDWNEVHLKARLRQHSTTQCLICWEDFKDQPQVLLSCSHVFHRACLSSFERYARVRCCPMCRAEQYQKKVIQDGAEAYRHQCATRIQAAARGWIARKRVRALRRHHPPQDARLKRTWAADRLEEQGDQLVAGLDAARGDLDALWAELDAGLALSRAVCSQLEGPAARRLQEQLQVEEAVARSLREAASPDHDEARALSAGTSSGGHTPPTAGSPASRQAAPPDPAGSAAVAVPVTATSAVDWPAVVRKAKARGQQDCPICIGRLDRRGKAGIAWLSCSHAFHLDCITAFEGYELSAGGTPTCPCCRAQYERRCFT